MVIYLDLQEFHAANIYGFPRVSPPSCCSSQQLQIYNRAHFFEDVVDPIFTMIWSLALVLIVVSLVQCSSTLVAKDEGVSADLLVHLTSGLFVGQASLVNQTDRWLGIPFAQPPLGKLRFKAPVSITNPSRIVKSATEFGNACPQLPSDTTFGPQGEDCLTLNVWRPIGASANDRLPVLVWFYVRTQSYSLSFG